MKLAELEEAKKENEVLYTVSPETYEVIKVTLRYLLTRKADVMQAVMHGSASPRWRYHRVDHTWIFREPPTPKRLLQIRQTLFRRQSKTVESKVHWLKQDLARAEEGQSELFALARKYLT